MIHTWAMCMALLLSGSLQGRAVQWQSIGSVGGMDSITQIHITNFLKQHGIQCMMGGSKTYGIFVKPGQAGQATTLLKQDAPLRGYSISFTDGTRIGPSTTKVYSINKPFIQVIKSSHPDFPALLLSVLRENSVQTFAQRVPIVVKFDVRRQDYMLPNGKFETAYEGIVELADHDQVGRILQSFEVWEQGKKIALQGTKEWKSKR